MNFNTAAYLANLPKILGSRWKGAETEQLFLTAIEEFKETIRLFREEQRPVPENISTLYKALTVFLEEKFDVPPRRAALYVARGDAYLAWADALLNEFEKDFQPVIVDLIQKKSTDTEFVSMIASDFNRLQEVLTEEIEKRYPDIDILKLIVNSVSIPDIRLYEEARRLYFETVQNPPADRLRQLQQEVTEGTQRLLQFQSLEELAKLLEKYPVLMEYAKINPTLETRPTAEP